MTQPKLLLHSKQVSNGATSDTLHTSVHAKYCCYCLYQVNHAFTTKYFNKSNFVDVDSTHTGSTTDSFLEYSTVEYYSRLVSDLVDVDSTDVGSTTDSFFKEYSTVEYYSRLVSDLVDVDSTHVGSTTDSFFRIFHSRILQQIGSGLSIASIGHGNS